MRSQADHPRPTPGPCCYLVMSNIPQPLQKQHSLDKHRECFMLGSRHTTSKGYTELESICHVSADQRPVLGVIPAFCSAQILLSYLHLSSAARPTCQLNMQLQPLCCQTLPNVAKLQFLSISFLLSTLGCWKKTPMGAVVTQWVGNSC